MFNKYCIEQGDTYCEPPVVQCYSQPLEFNFRLTYGWDNLLNVCDGSTHKIAGVSDLFGRNSVRLGVRRAFNRDNGKVMWRPILYTHKNGHISYPYIPNMWIRADGSEYNVKIARVDSGKWGMRILDKKFDYQPAYLETSKPINIFLFPRLQGPYIELGNDPTPVTTITEIEWL